MRGHIKGLSERNYQSLYQLKSLDFVLMFVPIEPAFMLAVTHDNSLFMDAWEKNVLLVSPSTLMFVLRTVAHLWRQEAQNRNAQEIAKARRRTLRSSLFLRHRSGESRRAGCCRHRRVFRARRQSSVRIAAT